LVKQCCQTVVGHSIAHCLWSVSWPDKCRSPCQYLCKKMFILKSSIAVIIIVYLTNSCVNWEFFWHEWASLKREWNERFKGPRVPKKKAQFTHERVEYNFFFCSTSPLKASNQLKSLKLAWRFVCTSCDIYQNPFTQEKILKFWQCWTKKIITWTSITPCTYRVIHERGISEFLFTATHYTHCNNILISNFENWIHDGP
jgi:hypothetical protein